MKRKDGKEERKKNGKEEMEVERKKNAKEEWKRAGRR